MRSDVVVVGAGVAGLTAALRLAEQGRRVVVVAHGVGSTHLAPARVDVLAADRPLEALDAFIRSRPDHPYALVGVDGVAEATAWFGDRVGYAGSADDSFVLPTAIGATKRSALVPESAVDGDLRTRGRFLIVGLSGLKDFYPELCAANLQRTGVRARAVQLSPPLDGETDVNALGFAARFEDERFREEVVAELRVGLSPGEHVGFPAVLGRREPVWRDLSERLRTPVFEIPTLPPSVPGIRLYDALTAALRAAGGRVITGSPVVGARTSGRRIEALVAGAAGHAVDYFAEGFVLATGGFNSGALELDSHGAVRDTVLDLPVSVPPGDRFAPQYFGTHAFARAGLAVDEQLHPLGGYENLYAAGATIAGAEPWREGSGEGIAISTGFAAAEAIVGAKQDALVA